MAEALADVEKGHKVLRERKKKKQRQIMKGLKYLHEFEVYL